MIPKIGKKYFALGAEIIRIEKRLTENDYRSKQHQLDRQKLHGLRKKFREVSKEYTDFLKRQRKKEMLTASVITENSKYNSDTNITTT